MLKPRNMSWCTDSGRIINHCLAEVEVDLATGEVSVDEFVAVHDSGKIVNRQLATGQVEGGVAQGLGYALMEAIEGRKAPNERIHDLPHSHDQGCCPKHQGRLCRSSIPLRPVRCEGLGRGPAHGLTHRCLPRRRTCSQS